MFRLKNKLTFLKAFKTSKKRTVVIDLNDNLDTDEKLLVRILRFRLETGEYEYLATNLFDRKYTIEVFKELDFQRWPIETKIKQVKSRFQLENFSGYSEEAIDQDFLITVFYCNLLEILRLESDKQISDILASEDCDRKHQYAAGEGLLASRLKAYLPIILSGSCGIEQLVKKIISSSHTAPAIISTFLYLHSVRMISLTSCFTCPYSTFRRYLGINTIWYWHFHRVCDKLLSSILDASYGLFDSGFRHLYQLTIGGFFCQPLHFCLFRSPRHSRGFKHVNYQCFLIHH